MKQIFIIVLLLTNGLMFGQLTKNVGSYTFENGLNVKEGTKVKLISGKNPQTKGVFLWVFEGGRQPIPERQCDESFGGRECELTKIISLKGLKNKDESIIGVFEIEKKKYYCFITQGLKVGELIIL